jgi:hypothetical protein
MPASKLFRVKEKLETKGNKVRQIGRLLSRRNHQFQQRHNQSDKRKARVAKRTNKNLIRKRHLHPNYETASSPIEPHNINKNTQTPQHLSSTRFFQPRRITKVMDKTSVTQNQIKMVDRENGIGTARMDQM